MSELLRTAGRRPSARIGALAVLLACACGDEAERGSVFALEPVVAGRIAALAAETHVDTAGSLATVAGATVPPPSSLGPSDDPELAERVRGLASEIAEAEPRWRSIFREELAQIGDAALPYLAQAIAEPGLSDATRQGAVLLLGAVGTPRAAEELLVLAERSADPTVRAAAAQALGEGDLDWIVPQLCRRLYYETDGATVIAIAGSLARFASFAGLDGLFVLTREGKTEEVRAAAGAKLAELASRAGASDASELWRLWNASGAPALPRAEPSPRQRLEVWRWIGELSGEHFQLRGVDEARFVLSRQAEWSVELLTAALHEPDVYTRVHVAQCLERMGPRGRTAGPTLLAMLTDKPSAPAAAAALGAIGHVEAVPALAKALEPAHDLDLRAAAARALGKLGDASTLDALRSALDAREPIDLRQAAAEALAALGAGSEVAPLLVDCLVAEGADAGAAETALERWLAKEAEASDAARDMLARWKELDRSPSGTTPGPEAVAERQRARHELLVPELSRLVRRSGM